jgi:hypothetical protein
MGDLVCVEQTSQKLNDHLYLMTEMITINHHLVLTKREWEAVINAIDFLDQELHGDTPLEDFVVEDLKRLFPHGFLDELSKKVVTS